MSNPSIRLQFTPAAVEHIQAKLRSAAQTSPPVFRLSMRKYGCNGYAFLPEIVETAEPDDLPCETDAPFAVFLDPHYAKLLNGTMIDYVVKSLGCAQLIFQNPNIDGECGCGESVNFKKSVMDNNHE
jgi:iron-sulfur cluster assembly accessory protein